MFSVNGFEFSTYYTKNIGIIIVFFFVLFVPIISFTFIRFSLTREIKRVNS